jgi:hypothetical protein
MTAPRAGATLMSWARRCLSPRDLEDVALPIIADIQFEVSAHAHRHAVVRGWVRVRGCFAFVKALGWTVLLHHWGNRMESKALAWLRLLLAIPAALLVSLAVQVGVGIGLAYLVYGLGGLLWGRGGEFGGWLVKVLTSPFMAAGFFWTMYLVVPRQFRRPTALGALVVVALWGALMVFAALTPWPRFSGWLFAMGLAGWFGGALSFWATRRGRGTVTVGG